MESIGIHRDPQYLTIGDIAIALKLSSCQPAWHNPAQPASLALKLKLSVIINIGGAFAISMDSFGVPMEFIDFHGFGPFHTMTCGGKVRSVDFE